MPKMQQQLFFYGFHATTTKDKNCIYLFLLKQLLKHLLTYFQNREKSNQYITSLKHIYVHKFMSRASIFATAFLALLLWLNLCTDSGYLLHRLHRRAHRQSGNTIDIMLVAPAQSGCLANLSLALCTQTIQIQTNKLQHKFTRVIFQTKQNRFSIYLFGRFSELQMTDLRNYFRDYKFDPLKNG